jgi:hypothetical protein
MNLETIIAFIKPELFVIVIFLFCIGLFLKKAPWFTSEWTIPFILLGISFIITIFYIAIVLGEGVTGKVIVTGSIQAVMIASITVFGNETLKQFFTKRTNDQYSNYNKRRR